MTKLQYTSIIIVYDLKVYYWSETNIVFHTALGSLLISVYAQRVHVRFRNSWICVDYTFHSCWTYMHTGTHFQSGRNANKNIFSWWCLSFIGSCVAPATIYVVDVIRYFYQLWKVWCLSGINLQYQNERSGLPNLLGQDTGKAVLAAKKRRRTHGQQLCAWMASEILLAAFFSKRIDLANSWHILAAWCSSGRQWRLWNSIGRKGCRCWWYHMNFRGTYSLHLAKFYQEVGLAVWMDTFPRSARLLESAVAVISP